MTGDQLPLLFLAVLRTHANSEKVRDMGAAAARARLGGYVVPGGFSPAAGYGPRLSRLSDAGRGVRKVLLSTNF